MSESAGNPSPKDGVASGAAGASTGSEGEVVFKTREEFAQSVNEIVHRAFSARQKDLEKKIDARFVEVQTGLSGVTSKFDEFGKLIEGLKPKPDADAEGKGKNKNAAEPPPFKLEDQPEWKAHQAELLALKKKAEAAELTATTEREKNRASTLRTKLAEQLATVAGIPADRHRAAMALLVTEEGRVGYSDEGKGDSIVWRGPDGEELTLEDGLKKWAKTPDAKIYQPPQNPRGSGGGPGRAPTGGGAQDTPDDILSGAIAAQLRGGVV